MYNFVYIRSPFLAIRTAQSFNRTYYVEPKTIIKDNKLDLIECTIEEVEKLLSYLKPSKSPGPDMIHPRIFNECATSLAPSLCYLFNQSFSSGIIPNDWKLANITRIYKKGKRDIRESFRPVSLTSVISKISETIVRNRIIEFLSTLKVIIEEQYGFTKAKSCLSQLLDSFHRGLKQGIMVIWST